MTVSFSSQRPKISSLISPKQRPNEFLFWSLICGFCHRLTEIHKISATFFETNLIKICDFFDWGRHVKVCFCGNYCSKTRRSIKFFGWERCWPVCQPHIVLSAFVMHIKTTHMSFIWFIICQTCFPLQSIPISPELKSNSFPQKVDFYLNV